MKKNNYIFHSLLILMVMLAVACHKDNQDYTYDQINDIKVTDDVTEYTVAQNEMLVINPTIVESKPGDEEYTYSWKLNNTDVLSTDKNLNIKATMSPGSYTAIFRATSVKTGISTIFRYNVTVQGLFYSGWYVVHNQAGKGKLSFIRTDDVIFDSPAETQNAKSYPGKALAAYYSSGVGVIFYFTDQNVYKFNSNDLFELGDISKTLPSFNELPIKTRPFYLGATYDQFLIVDGGLYMGLGPGFYAQEVLKPFSQRIVGDYSLFPGTFVVNFGSGYLFYDNKYQRFKTGSLLERSIATAAETPVSLGNSFDMAAVGRRMIAYDRGADEVFYYLMEDNAGQRFLMSTYGMSPDLNKRLNASPEIGNATSFATSSSVQQAYYTVGNKIYLHDIVANSAQLIYTFPAGYDIRDIEMVRTIPQQLVVAVNHNGSGEVYQFDIASFGRFVNDTYVKRFNGFGEIEQITQR